MPDRTKCTAVVEEAAEEIRLLSRNLRDAEDRVRQQLRELAGRLTPSRYVELMREGWVPWDAESYLHHTVEGLVDEDDFRQVEDLAAVLLDAARVTDEELLQEFLGEQWAAFKKRHPESKLPDPPALLDAGRGISPDGGPTP